jgi:membrane-associated phospholipid phosphatase
MVKKILLVCLILGFGNANAQNLDTKWLESINSQNTKNDKLWLGVTYTATPFSIATPLTLYAFGHFKHLPEVKKKSYAMMGGFVINGILTLGLKYAVNRERPYVSNPDIYKKSTVGPYSFPSGHTSQAFATATSITLAYPKWYVAVPAYLWAGSVGIAVCT